MLENLTDINNEQEIEKKVKELNRSLLKIFTHNAEMTNVGIGREDDFLDQVKILLLSLCKDFEGLEENGATLFLYELQKDYVLFCSLAQLYFTVEKKNEGSFKKYNESRLVQSFLDVEQTQKDEKMKAFFGRVEALDLNDQELVSNVNFKTYFELGSRQMLSDKIEEIAFSDLKNVDLHTIIMEEYSGRGKVENLTKAISSQINIKFRGESNFKKTFEERWKFELEQIYQKSVELVASGKMPLENTEKVKSLSALFCVIFYLLKEDDIVLYLNDLNLRFFYEMLPFSDVYLYRAQKEAEEKKLNLYFDCFPNFVQEQDLSEIIHLAHFENEMPSKVLSKEQNEQWKIFKSNILTEEKEITLNVEKVCLFSRKAILNLVDLCRSKNNLYLKFINMNSLTRWHFSKYFPADDIQRYCRFI